MRAPLRLLALAAAPLAAQQPPAAGQPAIPTVPSEVRQALNHSPLADGDGALFVVIGRDSAILAAGTGVADTSGTSNACAVARLRAERELARMIAGSHLESRIRLGATDATGDHPRQHFDEAITETVDARVPGAALAREWWLPEPRRCRVGLWLRLARVTR
jgi:hypothetical protein